jgi:hypothetical protein
VASIRHPVIAARLLYLFQEDFLARVDELLSGVLAEADVVARVRARQALLEPWIAADPWNHELGSWRYNILGDEQADGECFQGAQSSEPAYDCKLLDAVHVYLAGARAQAERIVAEGMPRACPRDRHPGADAPAPCP